MNNKILIIHTYGMGDMIMFTPALQLLQKQYPNAQIDIYITQKNSALPIFNNTRLKIIYSEKKFLGLFHDIVKLRKTKYDISITTSGGSSFKHGLFAFFVGAKKRLGESYSHSSIFYNVNTNYKEPLHRVENNIEIVKKLFNKPISKIPKPLFLIPKSMEHDIKTFLHQHNLKNKILFGIHPGNNKTSSFRRWPIQYYIKIVQQLQQDFKNIQCLFFLGPDEKELEKIISQQTHSLIVKEKSIYFVAKLIEHCSFFFNSDSGLGHVASCFSPHIFTIFSDALPYKISPYTENKTIISANLPCQPCYYKNHSKGCNNMKCLWTLSPEKVYPIIKNKIKGEYEK